MESEPPHETNDGGFPEQGGPRDNKKPTAAAAGRKLVIPPLEKAMREAGLDEV